MSFARIIRNVREFVKPSGKRRKGKTVPPVVSATTYEPFVLDMNEIADTLMRGLAETDLGIFRTDTAPVLTPVPATPRIRVTATLPATAGEIHPLARYSKRLVRPEDADLISPTMFRATGVSGLRVNLSTPVPVPQAMPERPAYPPRPVTPPPIPAPRSEAHSAPYATATMLAELEEETQEIYRDAGWDALFSPHDIFGADTLEMPKVNTLPAQEAHLCKNCGELCNGRVMGFRTWECSGCRVIARY